MKILVVQTAFLGDLILSTPVFAGIKTLFPKSKLSVLTTPAGKGLIERDPLVDEVLVFDKRGKDSGVLGLLRMARRLNQLEFERCYALQRSYRTALLLWLARIPRRIGFDKSACSWLFQEVRSRPSELHDALRNLSILRPEAGEVKLADQLRLYAPASEETRETVRALLESGMDYVLLAPGSVWRTKRWSSKHYREVAEKFLAQGKTVVVVGAAAERESAQEVANGLAVHNLAGQTTLPELLALVQHARLVICNDSMVLHVASAFARPTVAVFCATSPKFGFGPWRSPAVVVEQEGLACKPCCRHGGKSCPTGTEACMRELEADKVLAAAEQLLS